MESRITDDVAGWAETPAGSGYAGLAELADAGFTGAVDGGAWAFFVNGRVVGVFDGDIDDFEGATLTAREAPDPALPLLYAMQERGGDTRARYYTNDTPLSEVDETLESGGFTGYVELSENVLSGDYYVVYHGGKSMSVAFVGNNRRLVGGEEAFERAADEVGIYEVRNCDVDIVEIPEPADEPESASGSTVAGADGPNGDDETESSDGADGTGAEQADGAESGTGDDGETAPSSEAAEDPDPATEGDDGTAPPDGAAAASSASAGAAADADPTTAAEDAADEDDDTRADRRDGESGRSGRGAGDEDDDRPTDETAPAASEGDAPAPERSDHAGSGPEAERAADAAAAEHDQSAVPVETDAAGPPTADQFTAEERWRNARSIPAIDPAESDAGDSADAEPAAEPRRTDGRVDADAGGTTVAELREELAAAEERRDELAAERDELEGERDDLREERDELAAERDELEAEVDRLADRIEELEAEVERLRAASPAGGDRREGADELSPSDALAGTNLFVRYETKGEATLEAARDGEADRGTVNANLRLELHTRFDSEGVVVDGEPFDRFLEGTMEIRFVRWIVEDLLYELLDTGHAGDLDRLVDAIPRLDRAEFRGSVDVGEGGDARETFDVVFRDRRGSPLLVADINDSRTEAGAGATEALVESASRLRESHDSLAAALLVTSSFFDRGALAAAEDATSGGFLRSKRASFVRVARKNGYHLCLVEARGGDFHVNVPEL